MSENFGRYLLPRPDGPDDANVILWLDNLTSRLTDIFAGHLDLFSAGDFKVSSRPASHGRWLLCDGRELTQAAIEAELGLTAGDAAAFVALWGTGPTSIYDSDDSTAALKVRLPDAKGRSITIVGAGSGLTVRARNDRYGTETITLSAAQSGVRDHGHGVGSLAVASHTHGPGSLGVASHTHLATGNVTVDAHTHADGSLSASNHSHGAGSLGVNSHSHGIFFNTGTPSSTFQVNQGSTGFLATVPHATHIHLVNGNTDDQTPGVNGTTGDSGALDVSGNTSAASANGVTGSVGGTAPAVTTGATSSTAPAVSGSVAAVAESIHASNGQAAQAAHDNLPPSIALGNLFVRV